MNQLWRATGPVTLCAFVLTLARPGLAEEPTTTPAPLEALPTGTVSVTLHADTGRATIERQQAVQSPSGVPIADLAIAGLATWMPECTAPCEITLDPRYTYRVAGAGLVPSDSFTLPHGAGRVVIDAKMGSVLGRLGGLGLSAAGAGGLVLGGTALAMTPILAQDNIGTTPIRAGVLVSGIAVTTLSALVFGAGLWLWAKNDTTLHPTQAGGFAF